LAIIKNRHFLNATGRIRDESLMYLGGREQTISTCYSTSIAL
jgi:hypothetical protein